MQAGKIHKAAGLIIRRRKLLISRNEGRDFFINVGGKLEPGETAEQALVRELVVVLGEELAILRP